MREANISVSDAMFDTVGLGELIELGEAAGIREFEELACHGTGAVVKVTVEDRYDEDRLSTLACVDEWNYVAETDAGHVYVIEFTAPDLPPHLAEEADDLVGTCDPEFGDESVSLSLVGPQETIANTVSAYEAAGVSTELDALGSYDETPEPLDELTSRQQEVLRTAYEMGYFEVPREVSAEDIAAELDVDQSTVVEHLQRAERNLLGQFL